MTEATVGDGAPAVNSFRALRGLPRGLYCKAADVLLYMDWDKRTWRLWKSEGMRTDFPGTREEHVLTDWVIDFLASRR